MYNCDIIGIKFSPMDDEYIDTLTSIEVTVPDNGANQDQQSSVASLSMGTNTEVISCETCHFEKKKCPGHPGKLKLQTFVNSPLFIQEIVLFLKVFCHKCGFIVIKTKETSLSKIASVITAKLKKGLLCHNCGNPHPYVYEHRKDGRGNIINELSEYNKTTKTLTKLWIKDLLPNEIHEIFSRITQESLQQLGITPDLGPTKYLNKIFYVPPNSIRPNAYSNKASKIPKNDINWHINSVLRGNIALGNNPKGGVTTAIKSLQKLVYGFKKPLPGATDKQPISLYNMLSTKQGYIRNITLGARLLRIMRHFITGNPDAKLDEIYIPQKLAMEIQVYEVVHEHNIEKLMKYVANGSDVYPRCTNIYKAKENMNYLTSVRKNISIEPGDGIYRDLEDGDPILACRQPTLMKSNIAGLRYRVDKHGKSLTFNPNILTFFAGDFDGDEMNGYLPDTATNGYEAIKMGGAQELLISNGYGSPIIGQVQDGTLGLALLTRDKIKLTMTTACRLFDNTGLFCDMKYFDGSGRSVLTQLFKTLGLNINFSSTASYYNANLNKYRIYSKTEVEVRIVNSVFTSGIIDKNVVGSKKYNGLYHCIYQQYGAQITIDVIWYMQRIAINYLHLFGFTMHLDDFRINEEQTENIIKKELSMVAESESFTENLYNGKLIAPTGKTLEEFFENEQINILSGTEGFNEYIHKGMDYENNHLYFSVFCGAKGSSNNLSEVSVSCGQMRVKGGRLAKLMSGRASHFFPRDSTDPRSRGYILNSFCSGLTAADLFSASFPHRIGIVDKALSTAESGTKYREGISSLDSLITNHFRGVMKGAKLRQILYGGDGMDPRATFNVVSALLKISNKELKTEFEDFEVEKMTFARDTYRKLYLAQNQRIGEKNIGFYPVNLPLLLGEIGKGTGKDNKAGYEKLQTFINNIPRLYFNEDYTGPLPDYVNDVCLLFQCYLRYELRYKIVKDFSNEQVNALILLIKKHFANNLEDAGACVGIRSSQAISEPNTQQMLDSQHSQGGAKIDKFKDIMSATTVNKLSNLSMEIYFLEGVNATEFAKNIEMLKFSYFVDSYAVFYESFGKIVHPEYIKENELLAEKSKTIAPPNDITNWCVRVEFSLSRLITKNITLEEIYINILKEHPYFHIVFDTLNSSSYMRIYLRQEAISKFNIRHSINIKTMMQELDNVIIRGVTGIKTAVVKNKSILTINSEGELDTKKIEYVITDGTNLEEIYMMDGVDTFNTISNSIDEMHKFFGITASRNLTVDGLREAVSGAYYSHYTIFADEMNSCDFFSALNRNGSAARGTSICQLIADSAFLRFLKLATTKGLSDYNIGPNSAMIMGTTGKVGTNYNEVTINEEFTNSKSLINKSEIEDL